MNSTDTTATNAPVAGQPNDSGMAAKDPRKRRRALLIVFTIFVLSGAIWVLLQVFVFSTRVITDNAYVGGNQVAISAQVAGTVIAILADDTQHALTQVQRGRRQVHQLAHAQARGIHQFEHRAIAHADRAPGWGFTELAHH